jgi:hypothetical protein
MFGIDMAEHRRQFPLGSGFEEVVGEARRGYPAIHGDAKGVEHFLRLP